MLRPTAMAAIRARVLEAETRPVLGALAAAGAFELRREPAGPETAPLAPPDRSSEIAAWEQVLQRVQRLHPPADRRTPPAGVGSTPAWSLPEAQGQVAQLEAASRALAEREATLARRRQLLASAMESVAGLDWLPLPVSSEPAATPLEVIVGDLPIAATVRVDPALAWVLPIADQKQSRRIAVLARARAVDAVARTLTEAGFVRIPVPTGGGGTFAERFAGFREELERVEAEAREVAADRERFFAGAESQLAGLERRASGELGMLSAEAALPRTARTVLISGWVPAPRLGAVIQEVRRSTQDRVQVEMLPALHAPEAEIPILIECPRWLRPFSLLVRAYGLPRYREVVPTVFVAVSYVVMFGMMFGDVGHGFLLAMAGVLLRRLGRTPEGRDAGLLLLFGGLASMGFGCIYGSCFGVPAFRRFGLWHDPLEGDPLGLLGVAIAFGSLMLSLGLILNIVNRVARRDLLGACLDKFGLCGLLFYGAALVLLARGVNPIPGDAMPAVLLALMAACSVGWLVHEPLAHRRPQPGEDDAPTRSPTELWIESGVGVFEAVLAYLANTVSFVRLAAYAMSHAALLMAAFTLAGQLELIPAVGPVLAVVVILVGNLIALLLEGFVAAVQALRLEYHEFFGKFYAGTGRPFRPLTLPNAVRAPLET